jgi:hypothetical protein
MFCIIELNNLEKGSEAVKRFSELQLALTYMDGLASALSVAGYKITCMPAPDSNFFKEVQFLKAVKYSNADDENSEKEVIAFAMQYNSGTVSIVRTDMNDDFGDEPEYVFSTSAISPNSYKVIRESDKFVHYKRTDDNFITDIFLFHN